MSVSVRPDLASASVTFREESAREQAAWANNPFQTWTLPSGAVWAEFCRCAGGYWVRFPGLADFEISADGTAVRGWRTPAASSATLHQLYINQVLPLALSQQGELVLHASAVDIGGEAVAFVGPSGRGKSTLAGSFATHESGFLTDDGLQLAWRGGELTVMPSHPSLRLWDDSRAALGTPALAVAPAAEHSRKARFMAGGPLHYCAEPRPLRRVYFLGPGPAEHPEIRPLKPAEAMMALVRNSFLLDISEQDMLARHFSDFARIADLPIHYHLDYARHYDELPRLRQFITRHLRETVTE